MIVAKKVVLLGWVARIVFRDRWKDELMSDGFSTPLDKGKRGDRAPFALTCNATGTALYFIPFEKSKPQ